MLNVVECCERNVVNGLTYEANSAKVSPVSTIALHIIELVKSLPKEDQQAVRKALTGQYEFSVSPKRRQLQRLDDGSFYNPDGIPNDHPVFDVLAQIEEERHRMPGPPAPAFD